MNWSSVNFLRGNKRHNPSYRTTEDPIRNRARPQLLRQFETMLSSTDVRHLKMLIIGNSSNIPGAYKTHSETLLN